MHLGYRIRRGVSLLEAILSLTIFAGIAGVLAGGTKVTIAMLRQQEMGAMQNMSTATIEWVAEQIRASDQIVLVTATQLRLIDTSVTPAVTSTIRLHGRQLLLDRGGSTYVVAEPVLSLNFSDPSGAGRAVKIELSAGESTSLQPIIDETRTVALDWLKI